jgi:hypothetical protein
LRLGTNQPISPVFGVALFAAILLIPAIMNGFPFVFSDTGTYLRAAVERFLPWERPVFYSFFSLGFHLRISPWPIVVAQAVIVAVLIRIFAVRILSIRSETAFLFTAICLSFASSLPWFVGELIPDIFSATLIMSILIIGVAWDRLASWERAFAFAVLLGSVTFHLGNIMIAWAALLAFGLLWGVGWYPGVKVGPRLIALTSAVSLGTLAIVSVNALILGRAVLSPSSSTFMLAKLLHDGPAFTILEQNCPASGWALCAELDDLEAYRDRASGEPSSSVTEHFLWGGPLARLGSWKSLEPEAALVVRQALHVSPLLLLKQSAIDAWSQLRRFSVGDALLPYGDRGEPVDSIRTVFGEATAAQYLASSQARRELPLKIANVLQTSLVIGSFLVLACVGIYTRGRDPTVLYLTLALCGFVLLNAVVTATFSSVNDRYQSRIIWLIPMLALLLVERWLGTRQR